MSRARCRRSSRPHGVDPAPRVGLDGVDDGDLEAVGGEEVEERHPVVPRGLHADQRTPRQRRPVWRGARATRPRTLLRVSELERLDGDLPAVAHRGRHVRTLRDVDPDVEHLSPPSSSAGDEGFPSESAGATSWEIRRRTPFCLIRVHTAGRRRDSLDRGRTPKEERAPSAPFAPFIPYSRLRVKKRGHCARSGNFNIGGGVRMEAQMKRRLPGGLRARGRLRR